VSAALSRLSRAIKQEEATCRVSYDVLENKLGISPNHIEENNIYLCI
jgi:hypothetical protein